MRILKREFEDLPGVGGAEWNVGTISISVTQEQIQTYKELHGVDVIKMVEDVIANEVYMNLSNVISKTVRNRKPKEIKWQKESAYWLSDLLHKAEPLFILTNIRIAAGLQDLQQFETKKLDGFTSSHGSLYDTGTFDRVPLYVDPMLRYDEDELAIVESNFLEYEVNEEAVKLVMEGTMAPKVTLDFKYKIHEAKSNLYEIKELEF